MRLTRDRYIYWANEVAPLLKFNQMFYSMFLVEINALQLCNDPQGIQQHISSLESQLDRAIEDLKADLEI